MKKLLLIPLCLTAVIMLCACGGGGGLFSKPTPTPVPDIDPAELISVNDVTDVTGYVPVVEPSGTSRSGNVATVLYRSEPIGEHDTVSVKLTQFNDNVDYQQVFAAYEDGKSKRENPEMIEGVGQEAYIAFPTVHIYDRGCLIEITAGSGAGEEQRNILKSFALKASGKLEEIVPEYTPDE